MADWSRRRAEHAALAGIAATLAWAAMEELSSKRTVRLGGLLVLSAAAMAGLRASKPSAKAYAVENRFNHLLNNGGRFGGDIHVAGDHTVDGAVHAAGNVNSSGGNFNGGTINLSGNVNADGNVNGAHWPVGAGSNVGNTTATTVAGLRSFVNSVANNLDNMRGQMKGSDLFN